MTRPTVAPKPRTEIAERTATLFASQMQQIYAHRDRVFVYLFAIQWMFALAIALRWSPYGWSGRVKSTNLHVYYALVLGAAMTLPTAWMVRRSPGAALNRYAIGVVQMLWSALLIHLTGGRVETHFHVFGSLAFLAFYRDWKVLALATLTVCVDHLLRGMLWPESIYGLPNPEWWRFLEHAFWVVFEDIVLVMSVSEGLRMVRTSACRQAELEALNETIEEKIRLRTGELSAANEKLTVEIEERQRIETELRLAQKLEAVGRLAAGIAHEINTPVQFVSDSVYFIKQATDDLAILLGRYRDLAANVANGNATPEAAHELEEAEEEMDLPFVLENVPKALDRAVDGLGRVATIVRSMKEFAHPDQAEMAPVDLNRCIESTITIARNEYKYVAEVEIELEEVGPVTCHAGDVNQAILNLVVNAAHAIGDVVKDTDEKGRIRVTTRRRGDDVEISIQDTGTGIPPEILGRIFDPFFTTKEVGKGTGQGLALVRAVADKHHGAVRVESTVGAGSTFILRLPLSGASKEAA